MKVSLLLIATLPFLLFNLAQAEDSSAGFEAVQGWGTSRSYDEELGARASYIFSNNIFTGLDYSHFFSGGHSVRDINAASLEAGYRIQTQAKFELIPYLGAGAAFVSLHGGGGTVDRFLTNPGLKIDYPVGQLVVGLDDQYQIIAFHNSYAMAGTFGIRF